MTGVLIVHNPCDDTPSAPTLHQLFRTISIFLAGDLLVVPIGGHRTFLYGYKKYNRGSGRKRTNEQNEQYEPGVNSKCKTRSYVTLCIPVSICRLTQAWISSENSTTHEECWLILTRLPSLLWTSSHPTGLSAVRCRLPCPSPNAFSEFLCPTPFSRSLTHFWSRRDLESKTLCLVSRQNRQRNRLLGGPPT